MWQVFGASEQGTSHFGTETPCQDAHGFLNKDYYLIAAVADGLGSATNSREGSSIAVDTSLKFLQNALSVSIPENEEDWKELVFQAFQTVRENLEETATNSSLALREYGTTLILVVITSEWISVGHIGDGAAVVLLEDDALETISEPMRGEYANEVMPITSNDALSHGRFLAKQIPIKAAALFSDGLQSLSLDLATGQPHERFFSPFFDVISKKIDTCEFSEKLADFLNSDRVCSRTDDDKTMVVIGKLTSD